MIAVVFEVWPADDVARAQYLGIAAELRPLLDEIDGFLSIERFESLSEPSKILSLSFWRDEKAVAQWRNLEAHRGAQTIGRRGVFRDYRCASPASSAITAWRSARRRRLTAVPSTSSAAALAGHRPGIGAVEFQNANIAEQFRRHQSR